MIKTVAHGMQNVMQHVMIKLMVENITVAVGFFPAEDLRSFHVIMPSKW